MEIKDGEVVVIKREESQDEADKPGPSGFKGTNSSGKNRGECSRNMKIPPSQQPTQQVSELEGYNREDDVGEGSSSSTLVDFDEVDTQRYAKFEEEIRQAALDCAREDEEAKKRCPIQMRNELLIRDQLGFINQDKPGDKKKQNQKKSKKKTKKK